MGEEGEVIVQQAPVSVGKEALVTQVGDFRFFFGWRSDPFFFDVNGNFNHMQFTGDDFFKDKNVCSIVLELPNSELGTNKVGIWARTVDKTGRRLDPGRPRWKTIAGGLPPGRKERGLPSRRASK